MFASNIAKEMGQIESPHMAFGDVKCYRKFRKLGSYKVKNAAAYVTVIAS